MLQDSRPSRPVQSRRQGRGNRNGRALLSDEGRNINGASDEIDIFDECGSEAIGQMPVDVAMEEPYPRIVGIKSKHVEGVARHHNDVAFGRRVGQVGEQEGVAGTRVVLA